MNGSSTPGRSSAPEQTHRRRTRGLEESGAHLANYVAFDLLQLDGIDITGLPLAKRRSRLEALLATAGCQRVRRSARGRTAVNPRTPYDR
jgi:ATP-dependent DNA ligase